MVSSSSSHLSPHDAVRSQKGCRSPFRSTSADGVEQPTTICDSSRHAENSGCAAALRASLLCGELSRAIAVQRGDIRACWTAPLRMCGSAPGRKARASETHPAGWAPRRLSLLSGAHKVAVAKIYCERRRHDEKRRKNRKEWKTLGGFRADS